MVKGAIRGGQFGVEHPDTLVLNLVFLGTLGIALAMGFFLVLLAAATLLLVGMGKLFLAALLALTRPASGQVFPCKTRGPKPGRHWSG